MDFSVWKPPTLAEIDKQDEIEKKKEDEKQKEVVVDIYTENYIDELGLRSLKKQSRDSDVEQIDFSFLDVDTVDVPVQDFEPFSGIQMTATKTDMEISNITKEPDSIPISQNDTTSVQHEIYKTNVTVNILLNQSKSENATWTKNRSANPEDKNNLSNDSSVSQMKDNISTNHSMPTNPLPINSTLIPETANATLNYTTIPLMSEASNFSMTLETNVSHTFKAERMNSTQTMGNKNTERIIQTENIRNIQLFSYDVPPQGPTSNSTNEMVQLDIEDQTGSALNNESEIQLGGQQGPFGDGINATVLPGINASSINDTDTFYEVTQLTTDILSNFSEEAISDEMHNQTRKEVEVEGIMNMTKTNVSLNTVTKTENRNQTYSFGNETTPENSIHDGLKFQNDSNNVTKTLTSHNDKINTSIYYLAEQISSNHSKSLNAFFVEINSSSSSSVESFFNKSSISGFSASNQLTETSSEDLSDSESSEETVIYLQNHSSNAIRTSRLDPHGQNWTYDSTHQTVPLEIPYEHLKYLSNAAPQTTSTQIKKPKTKKVNLRQLPQKGRSMKTRKKKEFKPQPRSGMPVSPIGLFPGMSPRGMRPNGPQIQPVSSTEDLINMPVVIGVPRPDWGDYELYVPSEDRDNVDDVQSDLKQDEYEYVSYKDPYGSTDDMQSFTLDEVTKYYLKTMGENVRTYYISAEEVEWDYAGYGQR